MESVINIISEIGGICGALTTVGAFCFAIYNQAKNPVKKKKDREKQLDKIIKIYQEDPTSFEKQVNDLKFQKIKQSEIEEKIKQMSEKSDKLYENLEKIYKTLEKQHDSLEINTMQTLKNAIYNTSLPKFERLKAYYDYADRGGNGEVKKYVEENLIEGGDESCKKSQTD